MIIDNKKILQELKERMKNFDRTQVEELVLEPFLHDFTYRFCWSSNALEGNTLSLEETISLLEYDEVRGGHTFTEYEEAKNLYYAIQKMFLPISPKKITEAWIQEVNGYIRRTSGEYRRKEVYVGNLTEAVYYPPRAENVKTEMEVYLQNVNFVGEDIDRILDETARQHILFERIHPFQDGNGRTGRMILNQQLINHGLLPLAINPTGKYRQAFRIYDRNKDYSLMVHLLAKAELESLDRIQDLQEKLENRRIMDEKNYIKRKGR